MRSAAPLLRNLGNTELTISYFYARPEKRNHIRVEQGWLAVRANGACDIHEHNEIMRRVFAEQHVVLVTKHAAKGDKPGMESVWLGDEEGWTSLRLPTYTGQLSKGFVRRFCTDLVEWCDFICQVAEKLDHKCKTACLTACSRFVVDCAGASGGCLSCIATEKLGLPPIRRGMRRAVRSHFLRQERVEFTGRQLIDTLCQHGIHATDHSSGLTAIDPDAMFGNRAAIRVFMAQLTPLSVVVRDKENESQFLIFQKLENESYRIAATVCVVLKSGILFSVESELHLVVSQLVEHLSAS